MTSSSHQAADKPAVGLTADGLDAEPSTAWLSWWRKHWLAVLSHLAVVVIWSLASTRMPKFILPSPMEVLSVLITPRYNWPRHLIVTTSEVFGGFALASVIGVTIAVMFSWWPFINRAAMPLLVTVNMIPKVAMAPLFIVWLSYGIGPNILITFAICFFPIVINTARGLKEVEPDMIDLVRVLHASRGQILAKIQLPSALPFIFSGMRVAAVLAVAGAVVGEFIGSERGLGYVMMSFQSTMDTAGMFAGLTLITLVGVALYGLVTLAERWFLVSDSRTSK
jgi:NitT/TauT family transport system permease protein